MTHTSRCYPFSTSGNDQKCGSLWAHNLLEYRSPTYNQCWGQYTSVWCHPTGVGSVSYHSEKHTSTRTVNRGELREDQSLRTNTFGSRQSKGGGGEGSTPQERQGSAHTVWMQAQHYTEQAECRVAQKAQVAQGNRITYAQQTRTIYWGGSSPYIPVVQVPWVMGGPQL